MFVHLYNNKPRYNLCEARFAYLSVTLKCRVFNNSFMGILSRIFIIGIIISLFSPQVVQSQASGDRDSLFNELEAGSIDTTTFLELCRCINTNLYNDPDLSMQDARKVLDIALEKAYTSVIPRMILFQGIAYDLNGKYDSAILMYDSAMMAAQRYDDKKVLGDVFNNYGIVYSILGQLELSIEYSLKALDVFEEIRDSASSAKVYNNLGSRYSEMGMNEKAVEYYQQAILINEKYSDRSKLAKNFGNIGTVYSSSGQHEKALEYYTKAYMIQKDLNNKLDMSITLLNMAITHKNMQQYDLALSLAKQSFSLADETNDEIGRLVYYITAGDIYKEKKEYSRALSFYTSAEGLADSIGAQQNILEIYSGLADVHALLGNYRQAYHYNEAHNKQRISLLDEEKARALDMIQKFEKNRKQAEIDLLTKDARIQDLNMRRQKIIRNSLAGAGALVLLLVILLWHRYRYVRRTRDTLEEKNVIIQDEKEKSDKLLLNILPEETAQELKTHGSSKARSFEMVTVMFTDFKGFTRMAEVLSPDELVAEIDHCFKAFDNIISKYNIEKIKTIGDAYMCAGGLPVPNKTNPEDVVRAALEIRDFMLNMKANRAQKNENAFEIRIGVHTGPVIAGIVGVKKFQYDIWGDTVNIAARMESSGEEGKVNISETTYRHIKNTFNCTPRGKIQAKNKGEIEMYFVK